MYNNILLDLDNTLVDWTSGMNAGLRKIFPFFLTVSMLNRAPAFIRCFFFGMVYRRTPTFWESLEPLHLVANNILSQLEKLSGGNNNLKIYICTKLSAIDCPKKERIGKRRSVVALLSKYDIEIENIIFVDNDDCKTNHFPQGNCILLDDYYKNIEAALAKGHHAIHVRRVAYPQNTPILTYDAMLTLALLKLKQ